MALWGIAKLMGRRTAVCRGISPIWGEVSGPGTGAITVTRMTSKGVAAGLLLQIAAVFVALETPQVLHGGCPRRLHTNR